MNKLYSLFLVLLIYSMSTPGKTFAADFFDNNVYTGIGVTSNLHNGSKDLLLLLNYNHIFEYTDPKLSVGLLVGGYVANRNSAIFGLPVGFNVTENLNFMLTPSYVLNGDKTLMKDNEHFKYGDGFMLSVTGGYIIHLAAGDGRYTILPFISGDIINYEFMLSIGVKFGFNFTNIF